MLITRWKTYLVLYAFITLCALSIPSAHAQDWSVQIGMENGMGMLTGFGIVVGDGISDDYDGTGAQTSNITGSGILCLAHHTNGERGWNGPTGFYGGEARAPFQLGQSKTWWDIYYWAQNFTPAEGTMILFTPGDILNNYFPPVGYTGHLVLDQVPADYTGPMDYWFDLTQQQAFALPIPIVTDPLQGTKFHLTVYAPEVPEPSSILALLTGLAGIGGVAWRRRRV
ncbi:MAG: PEP-CTERM sorting domain-containing protein [Armatimonadota bacterium]